MQGLWCCGVGNPLSLVSGQLGLYISRDFTLHNQNEQIKYAEPRTPDLDPINNQETHTYTFSEIRIMSAVRIASSSCATPRSALRASRPSRATMQVTTPRRSVSAFDNPLFSRSLAPTPSQLSDWLAFGWSELTDYPPGLSHL